MATRSPWRPGRPGSSWCPPTAARSRPAEEATRSHDTGKRVRARRNNIRLSGSRPQDSSGSVATPMFPVLNICRTEGVVVSPFLSALFAKLVPASLVGKIAVGAVAVAGVAGGGAAGVEVTSTPDTTTVSSQTSTPSRSDTTADEASVVVDSDAADDEAEDPTTISTED